MKKILKSKKGVTVLEGLIAMTLLALVATGTFAVLLSTSRKSSQPDIREEMALAVEKAAQKLQVYVYPDGIDLDSELEDNISRGLCPGEDSSDPRATGRHSINCLLPPICDANDSSFSYTVAVSPLNPLPRSADQLKTRNANGDYTSTADTAGRSLYNVRFDITCNGFTL